MCGLERAMFAGSQKMTEANAMRMEVTNCETAEDEVLRIFKWTGTLVICIGLAITADNKRIRDGFLITRKNKNHGNVQVEAKKVWMEADLDTSVH
jgi:hypothetical protein